MLLIVLCGCPYKNSHRSSCEAFKMVLVSIKPKHRAPFWVCSPTRLPWSHSQEASRDRSDKEQLKGKLQSGYRFDAFHFPLEFQPYCSLRVLPLTHSPSEVHAKHTRLHKKQGCDKQMKSTAWPYARHHCPATSAHSTPTRRTEEVHSYLTVD